MSDPQLSPREKAEAALIQAGHDFDQALERAIGAGVHIGPSLFHDLAALRAALNRALDAIVLEWLRTNEAHNEPV